LSNNTCEGGLVCVADSEDEGFCLPKECNILDLKKVSKKKSNKHHVKTIDCITKGERCEGQTCEVHEICIAVDDDATYGHCFPEQCETYDLKILTKKTFAEDKAVKNVACLSKTWPCISDNTCEGDLVCVADSENEGFCLPAECRGIDFDLKKVKHNKVVNKVCSDEFDCAGNEYCSCRDWPNCVCKEKKSVEIETKTPANVYHNKVNDKRNAKNNFFA